MMFVDKYRPRIFDDLIGQDKIIATSKRWITLKDMPHVIAVGPPGCGKTTWAYNMASSMFSGFDVWTKKHSDFKEFNASDERGIDIVRGEIKDFASCYPSDPDAPFRICFLDEADHVTGDAQHAMRNTVEKYEDRCRFIMSGNRADYIAAMVSRAATFRFQAIPEGPFKKRFHEIAQLEKITFEDGVLDSITKYYKGDMRHALNDCLEKLRGIDHKVTMDDLDFTDDISVIVETVAAILTKNSQSAKLKYEGARAYLEREHARLQFNTRDFVEQLHDKLGPVAFNSAKTFSEVDDRIRAGGTKDVHLGYLLAVIANGGN